MASTSSGIHITLDLGGRYRLGPDVEWLDGELHYRVDPDKAEKFAAAVGRFLPGLRSEDLSPDYAGIRPKLQGPGDEFRDFWAQEASALGCPRLINLLGIESPGLTAAGAIARHLCGLVS